MIIVRVELHSARTGQVTELARANICNVGGTEQRGDYDVRTLRGRSKEQLDRGMVQRTGTVPGYRRLDVHVWNLVVYALIAAGYGRSGLRGNPECPTPAGRDAGTSEKETASTERSDPKSSENLILDEGAAPNGPFNSTK